MNTIHSGAILDTKTEIFTNAKNLFASKGYHATSMSMIAKACDKNKATLYHYYKSKEILYNEILAQFLLALQANIGRRTLPLPEARDQIRAYIAVLVEQDSDILRMINRQVLDGYDGVSSANMTALKNIQKSFYAIFKLGIGNGEFQMMSPETIYHMIFGACSHYVIDKSLADNGEDKSDKRFIDELFSIIILSIQA